jgi:hypothetical protein
MSPLRNLVQGMAAYASSLRTVALSSPGLQAIYDRLCDVLDELNLELEEEDEGSIDPDWYKFSTSDSENIHISSRA